MGSEDGQATVEHIGLMAFVAAALIAATAVAASASPGLRNAVRGGFEHALCVVTGDACASQAREACPTLRTVKTTAQGVSLSYLRLGHDKVLAIERRSDGTYELSLMEGLKSGAGIEYERPGGSGTLGAEAEMLLGHRAGRIYHAATPAEARLLVERLRSQHFPQARAIVAGAADLAGLASADPSVSAYVLAGDGAAAALGRFGLGKVFGGGGDYDARRELGVRISAEDREITAYATMDARASVFFEAMSEVAGTIRTGRTQQGGLTTEGGVSLGKPGRAGGGEGGGAGETVPVTLTNPLAQRLEGEAFGGGSIALRFGPGPELLGVEVVGYVGSGDRQRELRARLDPTDPDVRAAIERWRADPGSAPAIADLGRVARDRAALDVRTFETTRTDHRHGGTATVRGHGLGLDFGSESVVSRLVSQQSRPSGGEWEHRTDCLPTVAG